MCVIIDGKIVSMSKNSDSYIPDHWPSVFCLGQQWWVFLFNFSNPNICLFNSSRILHNFMRKTTTKTEKDKYKVLQRLTVCYIFGTQAVQGFQIWYWLSSSKKNQRSRQRQNKVLQTPKACYIFFKARGGVKDISKYNISFILLVLFNVSLKTN